MLRNRRYVAPLLLALAGLISGLAIATGEARSTDRGGAGTTLGPVSHRLLRFLNSPGPPMAFQPAGPRAKPNINSAAASVEVLHDARWHPVSVTGISLVRFAHRTGEIPAGTLAWLASVEPRRPVYGGTKTSPGPAANYFVVVIGAGDGRFLADENGYSGALANHRGGPGWATGEFR